MNARQATHGTTQTTDSFDALCETDVGIIGIHTPGLLHADQIFKALDAGKHVMVTKSMVYSMEEVEAVIEAVDRSGKVLLVIQTMRGRYDFIEAKRVHDAGEIGELFTAEAHYVHDLRPVCDYSPWRVQMPQDLILRCVCRPIDLLHWFVDDIEEVYCYGLRGCVSRDYPNEDNFLINCRFTRGKIGRVTNILGAIHPPGVPCNSLTVYGTNGTIRDSEKWTDPGWPLPIRTTVTTFSDGRGRYGEMLVMLYHVADYVLNGTKPWVDVRDGARIVATGLACWELLRSGQPETVRNTF